MLPSLRSSSCQHQISPLPSSVLTPTQVRRALLTRIESDEVEGVEREMAAVVGANEGPTVIDDSGVWSASCRRSFTQVSSSASSSGTAPREVNPRASASRRREVLLHGASRGGATHVVDREADSRGGYCEACILARVRGVLNGSERRMRREGGGCPRCGGRWERERGDEVVVDGRLDQAHRCCCSPGWTSGC